MAKLLLMSVIIVSIAFPMIFAKEKNPKSGIRKVVYSFMAFVAAWTFFAAYIYGDIATPPKVQGKPLILQVTGLPGKPSAPAAK